MRPITCMLMGFLAGLSVAWPVTLIPPTPEHQDVCDYPDGNAPCWCMIDDIQLKGNIYTSCRTVNAFTLSVARFGHPRDGIELSFDCGLGFDSI